ncbi:MAG: hypothetical protein ACYS14_03910 [Planctomycetota bacterium]|jgi:hypothetical protein
MMENHQHAKPSLVSIVWGAPPPSNPNMDATVSTQAINKAKSPKKQSSKSQQWSPFHLHPTFTIVAGANWPLTRSVTTIDRFIVGIAKDMPLQKDLTLQRHGEM